MPLLSEQQGHRLPAGDDAYGTVWKTVTLWGYFRCMGSQEHWLDSPFFDEHGETDITVRNLPHWTQEGKIYFVTWRLADSLSKEALDQLVADRKTWQRSYGAKPLGELDLHLKQEWYRLFHHRVQEWLDAGHGACTLRDPYARRIMIDTLRHFHGQRYLLGTFAIASNHVHVLVAPMKGADLSTILHSWKSFSAIAINRALGRNGRLWMDEYFDRLIRNQVHLDRVQQYIEAHKGQGAFVEYRELVVG